MFTQARLAADALLRDPYSNEDEVLGSLQRLGSADFICDDFGWATVNLSLALGPSLPMSTIHLYAAEVIRSGLFRGWKAYSFLASLEKFSREQHHNMPSVRHIEDADPGLLQLLTRKERGLILCTYHIGAFRFIPFTLAAHGFKVNVLGHGNGFTRLNTAIDAARHSLITAGKGHEALRGLRSLRLFDPTKPGAIVRLIKALRSGELAVIYVDGNLGVNGAFDRTSTEEVDFTGTKCLVKSGAARLASMANVAVLPICALTREQSPAKFNYGELIFPSPRQSRQHTLDSQEMMQAIYRFFEAKILEAPWQWESSRFMHRVRQPAQHDGVFGQAVSDQELDKVSRLLQKTAEVKLQPGRLMPLDLAHGRFWIDLAAMKLYRHEHLDAVMLPLAASGLNSQHLANLFKESVSARFYLRCIAQLKTSDIITFH